MGLTHLIKIVRFLYLIPFKFGELLGGHCPFQVFGDSSHGGTVERHMQCTQSPMHLVESAALSGSSRCVALFNELWEQKLINNFNYCLQQH